MNNPARSTVVIALITILISTASHASEKLKLRINGTELEYVSEGRGAPVLFLHGAISDQRVWVSYRLVIREKFRFLSYNQRYFGTIEWPDDGSNFQRETHIEDLIAFIEQIDIGPVHLVTWSYSGEIGANAILRRPDLFLSAVHFEPVIESLLSEIPGSSHATKELFKHFAPAVRAAKNGNTDAAALRFIEAVFRLPPGSASDESESAVNMWRENGSTVPPYLLMSPGNSLMCDDIASSSPG